MSKRKPNREEQLIIRWLENQGYDDIQYEPDGNVPPDILLNGNIAIEVRRLNENIRIADSIEGLEKIEYAVHNAVCEVLEAYNPYNVKKSAIVSYYFRRPIQNFKKLKKDIKSILQAHESSIDQRKQYFIGCDFELHFWPLEEKQEKLYIYGASIDFDAGGFLLDKLYVNMKWAAEEKDTKIRDYKSRYDEWWLALVDTIALGMNERDLPEFYKMPKIETSFDRILIVSSSNPDKFVFLYE